LRVAWELPLRGVEILGAHSGETPSVPGNGTLLGAHED
jgi:hypothetical protein